MRYVILSDLHGNRQALEAVLAVVPLSAECRLVVLGDLVGYGADPNFVVARVRALDPAAVVRGNHDKVACGLASDEEFTPLARTAIAWTAAALTPENRAYLRGLPAGPLLVSPRLEVCHGSPADEDQYIVDSVDALDALAVARAPVCLFGHTHVAVVFERDHERLHVRLPESDDALVVTLHPDRRYLINPGSVGQPRDGDPRAAFAVLDDEAGRAELRRVAYPVEEAQAAILAAGLPPLLAHRLASGR